MIGSGGWDTGTGLRGDWRDRGNYELREDKWRRGGEIGERWDERLIHWHLCS